MKKRYRVYSEELVHRINELNYDLTKEQYQDSRPEIFEQEKERWERVTKQFFNFSNPITIVDIGTGTGFVPLTIAKFAKKEDTFICSDVSRGILSVAKRNIVKKNFHCQFRFVKLESQVPFQLPFETESADMLTVNSVLHHVKDTNAFLNEMNRILRPNGLLFVAHEPNRYFYENKFLWHNYLFMNSLDPANFEDTAHKILRRMYLDNIVKKIYYSLYPKRRENALEYERITSKINETLLEEELIRKPLLPEEIIDAVEIRDKEGFKPNLLFPNYDLLHFETYNHISSVTVRHYNSSIIRKYDRLLRRRYPQAGATFFTVFKKIEK